jgi:ABC-2 type transport system permease protein
VSGERIREMVKKEFRQLFRDPRLRRVIFIAPMIQLIVFGYAVSTDIRNTPTFVVDQDGTRASRDLVEAFTASGYFRVVGRSLRPADLVRALDHGTAIVGLVIPAGYAGDLAEGRARVQILLDGTNSNTATVARGYAERIVLAHGLASQSRPMAAPVPSAPSGMSGSSASAGPPGPSAPAGASDPSGLSGTSAPSGASGTSSSSGTVPPVDLRARAWYNPDLASRNYNVPAVVGAIILLVCLLLTSLAIVREREIGTLEQLRVSPLSPGELILGKTIPFAAIGLVDLALITAVALFWFGIPFRGSALLLLLASVLYLLSALGVGLLISTISRTQQEAFMAAFLVFMPTILLSGFMFPITSMPKLFQWLTLANPMRHYLEVVRAVFLKGSGPEALWPQLLALAATGTGILWLAAIRFRRQAG